MHLDHSSVGSILENSELVTDQLKRLRTMLIRLSTACISSPVTAPVSVYSIPQTMLVRLHSNADGGLWYNTGEPRYDTQVGVAQIEITLSAIHDDAQIERLASLMVNRIACMLAERAA